MQSLKTLPAPCRHTFCRMYGLTTTDRYSAELCLSALNGAIDADLIDIEALELIYRTEGYLAALEKLCDLFVTPLKSRLPTTCELFRGDRQEPLIEVDKGKVDQWRREGAFNGGE